MFSKLVPVVSIVFVLLACVTPDSARIREVLDTDLVTFESGTVPDELVDTLSRRKVLLLGETHYVQEHQEFVLELLIRLHPHGLRLFAQEMPHAYGWIVDDYVTGERDNYPESVRRMDEYWIEGLRAFNEGLPESERIRFSYIDMNHAHDACLLSLSWMVRGTRIGESIGPLVVDVLETHPGTDGYIRALVDLEQRLASDRARLEDTLGLRWYARLVEVVEIELRSIPVRERFDNPVRERIMIDLANRAIENAAGSSVALNVGMYHAQRRRYMGTRQEWLGEYLSANAERFGGSEQLYSVAFWGFSGERIRNFMDRNPEPVPEAMDRPTSNFARQIAEIVARRDGTTRPESAAFIELSDPAFARSMQIAFSFSRLRAAPGRQFDAYLVFPEISVLESIRRAWE